MKLKEEFPTYLLSLFEFTLCYLDDFQLFFVRSKGVDECISYHDYHSIFYEF